MKRTGDVIELPKAKRTCNNMNVEKYDITKNNNIIIIRNTPPNIPNDPEVWKAIMKCKFKTKFN